MNTLITIMRILTLLVIALPVALAFSLSAQAKPLQSYFNGINNFTADFTQKLFDAEQNLKESSSGVISVKRPNKFRLEYTKPYRQTYVADGKKLWSYDEDLEQVIVKTQQGALANSPAMILSNPQDLEKHYRVQSQGSENDLAWFELKPKHQDASFDVISLAFDNQQLRIMELLDGFGQITHLEFDNMQKNTSLKSSVFRFQPPKGVDVISQ